MSTITGMINAGAFGVTGSSYAGGASASTFETLNQELESVKNSTELTDDEKQEKLESINNEISRAASTQSVAMSTKGNLVSSMLGVPDNGDDGFGNAGFFFGTGYTLANVKSLYSASKTIEKEARVLSAQIAVDKIRGLDTADKQEKLANLTENVNILNNNLSSQIESALADKEADKETLSVIGQIKEELEANQKELDKEFGTASETADEKTETEAADAAQTAE